MEKSRLYYAVKASLDQINAANYELPHVKDNQLGQQEPPEQPRVTRFESDIHSVSSDRKTAVDYSQSPLFARLEKQDETIRLLNRHIQQLTVTNRNLSDQNEDLVAQLHHNELQLLQSMAEVRQTYIKRLQNVETQLSAAEDNAEHYRLLSEQQERRLEQQERHLRELEFHIDDLQSQLAQAKAAAATFQTVAGASNLVLGDEDTTGLLRGASINGTEESTENLIGQTQIGGD